MKRIALAILLLAAALFATAVAGLFIVLNPSRADILQHSSKSAHMFNTYGDDGSICSSTAIGPYTLLTASHCLVPTDKKFWLFGEGDGEVTIIKEISDSTDHTILVVDKRMKSYSSFDDSLSVIGDEFFIFGNPFGVQSVYRSGTFAGQRRASSYLCNFYNINVGEGDSGSGIFDSDGVVRGVVNAIATFHENGDEFRIACSIPDTFTEKQLSEVR